ncbi:endonuclease MutS2 [Lacticaseibacillus brantae]|uniref:DNA mismatch repair protein MutS2 n=1 Tax=Lacticaseibacillus brantae DSM 23927 TaxID=1423727 RepID=A0A0R2AXM6_9LACO|nr:mannonate oxidoreductase [Lacticaseibacillus brantae]KRM71450.1 DNA mismatch repair protein MutS2 [Lacticaseibacillus brantae DSM 23927]
MQNDTLQKLQFNEIKAQVKARAIGHYSQDRLDALQPQTDLATVETWQQETLEARRLLDANQHVPFLGLNDIDRLLAQLQKGLILSPIDLIRFADFLRSSRLLRQFFETNMGMAPLLNQYASGLPDFSEIENAIYSQIQHQQVADSASRQLRKLRRQLQDIDTEIQDKLQRFIRHADNQRYLQEPIIVKKSDHYTVPIQATYKNKIEGNIVESSNKGTTVYVEPNAVAKLNAKYAMVNAEAVAEEYQVLAELTGRIAEAAATIDLVVETITALDIIMARAKYSREIDGQTPQVNKAERIIIHHGRHPLLPKDAVPLDLRLGTDYRGLVITGPNAGGKTVTLKTVGLLTLMTMFGLQIPAEAGTDIAVMDHIFVDMGDQQDLGNALSTFSGHMHNVAGILSQAGRNTLVLLDEIGSGTEPNEGAALAIAIMETLYSQGALIMATTHYGEIKRFAEAHADFIPAAMAFDQETLMPKYQLKLGVTGDSQALWIARKMKMSTQLLRRAEKYLHTKDYQVTKQDFPGPKATPVQNTPQFVQGDRVWLSGLQQEGLVYQDDGDELDVFVNHHHLKQPRRRVQLLTPASELYPEGYELARLFVDYDSYKQQRDLNRGSKAAQRQLRKAAAARKTE